MSDELVSVITRTRDRPEMLREAVASVAAQTWPAVELVVVNDGGEDVTEVLRPFRDTLAITYLEPGTVGRCRAGNLGVMAARGRWIAWLDDDDLHYPDHLSAVMAALDETGRKVAYSDAHRIDVEPDPGGGGWREVGRSVPYSEDFSRIMLFRRAYIHLSTIVYHRECFERLGGFDESLEVLEDWDLFFRFAQDYDFVHVAQVTAAFRIRSDQSNAVTALRRDFADTRSRLFARYIHLAFPELLGLIEAGQETLNRLAERIARLEAGPSEGEAKGRS
jgi:glycosyltransferase involved in cell wall biosynthesis